jgi:hypothetical protein
MKPILLKSNHKPEDPDCEFFVAELRSNSIGLDAYVRCRVFKGGPVFFYNKIGFCVESALGHVRGCRDKWREAYCKAFREDYENWQKERDIESTKNRKQGQQARRKRERKQADKGKVK